MPFVLLLITAAGCPSQSISASGSISVEGLGTGAVSLSGPWKFHLGDDLRWALQSFDDSGWESIRADRPWGQLGHAGYTGYAWYRAQLSADPSGVGSQQFSLLVPHVRDAYEVFWNGKLIGREGKMPPWPVWHVSQHPQTFPIGGPPIGLLAIRVWKAPLFSDDSGEVGGFDRAPVIGGASTISGSRAVIDYEWLRTRQFEFGEQLIYGLIALLSFLLWWWNRGQRVLIWMIGYALAPMAVTLLLDAHLALPYSAAMGLTQPANCIHDVSLWFLLLWLLHLNELPAISRVVKIFAVVSLCITCLDGLLLPLAWNSAWVGRVQVIDAAITSITTILEIIPLVLVTIAVRRKRRLQAASWIVAGMTIFDGMFLAVQQALRQGQRFTGWTVGNELAKPLFTIAGNAVSLDMVLRGMLLVAIVAAVYLSYREERQAELLLANEFSRARELQRMLFPENQHSMPGFTISSSYRPALEVGGDFFQLMQIEGEADDAALLLLGDVSGHGLKAALSVSYVMGILRVLAEHFQEPGLLLTEMNRRLCGQMENGFVTCIAARIDRYGACTLSSAGHPPPFLNWQSLDVPGALPLGLEATATYDQTRVRLKRGDHLALYTDGLLEARNRAGELYGFERLQKLFAANPTAPEAAEEAVRFGQDDDVTVVTLTYIGENAAGFDERILRPDFAHF